MLKNQIFCAVIFSIVVTACNHNAGKNEQKAQSIGTDSIQHAVSPADKAIPEVPVAFTRLDDKAAQTIKAIADYYLQIKNALAADQPTSAAKAAGALSKVMKDFDKSLLTAEQKKHYDDIEEDLQEHAEHIEKNASNMKHQREHFSMMSADVYDLVKAFGAGRPLYHDHCPMYNDNQGAMWLSETREIKNPYYGAEMPACGTVEEIIR